MLTLDQLMVSMYGKLQTSEQALNVVHVRVSMLLQTMVTLTDQE
jgi:hypothetical protein